MSVFALRLANWSRAWIRELGEEARLSGVLTFGVCAGEFCSWEAGELVVKVELLPGVSLLLLGVSLLFVGVS